MFSFQSEAKPGLLPCNIGNWSKLKWTSFFSYLYMSWFFLACINPRNFKSGVKVQYTHHYILQSKDQTCIDLILAQREFYFFSPYRLICEAHSIIFSQILSWKNNIQLFAIFRRQETCEVEHKLWP